ncbi:MAG: hypothetical protein HUU32_03255 [Calditrichaceae bacterium]|nr:hypothetical protein [Calditrichia bacterium]NUQ40397.1 hypothetical protein [Calditrichaceae bacterium]
MKFGLESGFVIRQYSHRYKRSSSRLLNPQVGFAGVFLQILPEEKRLMLFKEYLLSVPSLKKVAKMILKKDLIVKEKLGLCELFCRRLRFLCGK